MIKFYNKSKDEGQIDIYGEIGESFWGESKSASDFKKELDKLGEVKSLKININSPGGSVFDGLAIYNMLKRHAANKTVYIDGLAASAASFVAMAADEIVMPKNAYLMIHNAWTFVAGNKEELAKRIETLANMDDTIAGIYADRTGKEKDEMSQMMLAETWLNGQQAHDKGFIDVLEDEAEIAALIEDKHKELYKNMPENIKEHREEPETLEPVSIEQRKLFNQIKLKILGGI